MHAPWMALDALNALVAGIGCKVKHGSQSKARLQCHGSCIWADRPVPVGWHFKSVWEDSNHHNNLDGQNLATAPS